MVRRFISELLGTMLLVIFGCGTAVAVNNYVNGVFGTAFAFTLLIIALAFGLIVMALAYTFGKISGAHVNPAISLAMLIDGRMSATDCVVYIFAQILGGICGAEVLGLLFGSYEALGANGYAKLSLLPNTTTLVVALVVEVILTFVFALVVLTTTKDDNKHAGIVIGLTLTLVHIFGIPFTGTSVNPARSIGPALLTGGEALSQMWVFVVAPLVGGALAALFHRFVIEYKEKAKKVEE